MSFDLRYNPEIVDDREDLKSEKWKVIEQKIREVQDEGTKHKDVKLVPNSNIEHPIWEMTVNKTEEGHRVFLDIKEGVLVVLAVWNFKFTHSGDKHWEKLQERMN